MTPNYLAGVPRYQQVISHGCRAHLDLQGRHSSVSTDNINVALQISLAAYSIQKAFRVLSAAALRCQSLHSCGTRLSGLWLTHFLIPGI